MKAPTFQYFGKWSPEGVVIRDKTLERYIKLEGSPTLRSGGVYSKKQFGRVNVPIVERLINRVMRSGPGDGKIGGRVIRGAKACGKKYKAYNIVKKAFEHIHKVTGQNPLQVLVDAIVNCAPREEITRITYGGITYPISVDVSPLRRVDIALKNIAAGAFAGSFRNKKPIWQCLAEEIILASKADPKSYAFARKEEIERIAKGAR